MSILRTRFGRISTTIGCAGFVAASAFAGGARFVPLNEAANNEDRFATGVGRDLQGNPLVAGSRRTTGTFESAAAAFTIANDDSITVQDLAIIEANSGSSAEDVSRFSGRITGFYFPGSFAIQGCFWDDTSQPAAELAPLNLSFNLDPTLGDDDDDDSPTGYDDDDYDDDDFAPESGLDPIVIVGATFNDTTVAPTMWQSSTNFAPEQLDVLSVAAGFADAVDTAIVSGTPRSVGFSINDQFRFVPVIWLGTQILQQLDTLNNSDGIARAISENGRALSGDVADSNGFATAAIWTDTDENDVYDLITPTQPAGISGTSLNAIQVIPTIVTGEPELIAVGNGFDVNDNDVPVIFQTGSGLRTLADVLTNDFGLDLQGFELQRVTGLHVDDDGTILMCGDGFGAGPDARPWFVEIPGAVPPVLLGDMNCDGIVSVSDIGPFVVAITTPDEYPIQFPDCNINNGDLNGDGQVYLGDIGLFVALLSGS